MTATTRPLTPKQQRFVEEYLVGLNASDAARKAGYSRRTADRMGFENLQKPEIAAAIAAAMQERSRRTQVTADRVLLELARIAFFDPRKMYNADGSLKSLVELDDEVAAVLAQIEVFEEFEREGRSKRQVGVTRKVRLWGKVDALKLLAQHLNLFEQRTHVDLTSGGKPLEPRDTLTPEDIRAVAGLLGMAGAGVSPER